MKITILKKKSSWIFLISFLAVLTGSFLIPEQRYKSIFKPKKNNLLYKAKILKYKSRYSPVEVYKKYDAFENKYSCLIKSEVDIGSEKDYFPINLSPNSSYKTTKYKIGKVNKIITLPEKDGRGDYIYSWKIPYSEWHKHKILFTRFDSDPEIKYDLGKLKKAVKIYLKCQEDIGKIKSAKLLEERYIKSRFDPNKELMKTPRNIIYDRYLILTWDKRLKEYKLAKNPYAPEILTKFANMPEVFKFIELETIYNCRSKNDDYFYEETREEFYQNRNVEIPDMSDQLISYLQIDHSFYSKYPCEKVKVSNSFASRIHTKWKEIDLKKKINLLNIKFNISTPQPIKNKDYKEEKLVSKKDKELIVQEDLTKPEASPESLINSLSAEEKNIAVIKAFNICKTNQGISSKTLKSQAYKLLDTYQIDRELLSNKKVEAYANFLLKDKNFCSKFEAFDSYIDFANNQIGDGEKSFNNLSELNKKAAKKASYALCMVSTGKFSMQEQRDYMYKSFVNLVPNEESFNKLINDAQSSEFNSAASWLMTKMNPSDCEIK